MGRGPPVSLPLHLVFLRREVAEDLAIFHQPLVSNIVAIATFNDLGIAHHAGDGDSAFFARVGRAVVPGAAVPANDTTRLQFDMLNAVGIDHLFDALFRQLGVDAVLVQDMRDDLCFVAARDHLQTAVFERGRVQRHPKVEWFGIAIAPEPVVLMPGRGAAGAGRFQRNSYRI